METKNKKVVPKKRGRPPGSKSQKGRGHLRIIDIERALKATGGFITYAAKKLNCSYQNIRKRIDSSPRLQQALIEINESSLDFSEHSLFQQIKDGNTAATLFHLKCKGKDRGYVEKQQIETKTITEAQPVKVVIEVEDGRKG